MRSEGESLEHEAFEFEQLGIIFWVVGTFMEVSMHEEAETCEKKEFFLLWVGGGVGNLTLVSYQLFELFQLRACSWLVMIGVIMVVGEGLQTDMPGCIAAGDY